MDELCAISQADPVAFRLQHLKNSRVIGVLKAAAEAVIGRHALHRGRTSLGRQTVSGRGIACVAYEGDNGYAALVAEVDVDLQNRNGPAEALRNCVDCGPISNPDGLRNQTEGASCRA